MPTAERTNMQRTTMCVDHVSGSTVVDDEVDVAALLAVTTPRGVNEFWFVLSDASPALAVMVRGRLACVHYFPYRPHPGFQSLGDQDGSPVSFAVGSPSQMMDMPRRSTVPLEAAVAVVRQFVANPAELPGGIPWFEL